MESNEIVSSGGVGAGEVEASHGEGFAQALDKALLGLDASAYADMELEVRYSIRIAANPGGVGQYRVELVPKG